MKKALFTLAAIAAFVATTTAAETSVTMTTVTATSAAATTATTTSVTTTTAAATSVTATTAAAANAPQDGAGATMPENNGIAWFIVLPALVVCILAIAAIWRFKLIKTNLLLAAFTAGVAGIAFLIGVGALFGQITFEKAEITMIHLITFIGALATFTLFAIRTADFNQQLKLQIKKEIDDRFHSAVQLLGNAGSSARTGAIYSLYHLAMNDKKYRKEIPQILCSHIRSKTEEDAYRKQHGKAPSNEIQTAINLLFRDAKGIKGLYTNEKILADLPKADLSHSYLVGAIFYKAICPGVIFARVNCKGAMFLKAQLVGATFMHARLQCASFQDVHCQSAVFENAKCQGAVFINAKCQGAYFIDTKCQGANFSNACLQCIQFPFSERNTECHGAYATETEDESYLYPLSERITALSNRIGKPTEFQNAVFSGEIDAESVQVVEKAKRFLEADMQQNFQDIIDANKGKSIGYEMPKNSGMATGVLEDNEGKIEKIIKKLRKVKKNQLI